MTLPELEIRVATLDQKLADLAGKARAGVSGYKRLD